MIIMIIMMIIIMMILIIEKHCCTSVYSIFAFFRCCVKFNTYYNSVAWRLGFLQIIEGKCKTKMSIIIWRYNFWFN